MIRGPAAKIITGSRANGLEVDSAGLIYPKHNDMAPEMRAALINLGYNPKGHTPKKATKELLESQNLVLCMESSHLEKALKIAPGLKNVHTLPEYAGIDMEIQDSDRMITDTDFPLPNSLRIWGFRIFSRNVYAGDQKGVKKLYQKVAKDIEECVLKVIETI